MPNIFPKSISQNCKTYLSIFKKYISADRTGEFGLLLSLATCHLHWFQMKPYKFKKLCSMESACYQEWEYGEKIRWRKSRRCGSENLCNPGKILMPKPETGRKIYSCLVHTGEKSRALRSESAPAPAWPQPPQIQLGAQIRLSHQSRYQPVDLDLEIYSIALNCTQCYRLTKVTLQKRFHTSESVFVA